MVSAYDDFNGPKYTVCSENDNNDDDDDDDKHDDDHDDDNHDHDEYNPLLYNYFLARLLSMSTLFWMM